jgi:hypothetical protein
VSLRGAGNSLWDLHSSKRDVPSCKGREHGSTSSSPRASVISIPELSFLLIAIVLEVHISCYHLCYIYLVPILLSSSCYCYRLVELSIFRVCACKLNVSLILHSHKTNP